MPYRNKTYICFDGDKDIHYYYLMKAWKASDHNEFNFFDAHDLNAARDSSQISSRAQFLIDNFGDNEQILSILSSDMSSFGWSGSVVPYLKKEISALECLKDHEKPNVRTWAARRIDYLDQRIERESRRDEEHDSTL